MMLRIEKNCSCYAIIKVCGFRVNRHLNDVVEEIPPQLILNWDQTGIHLVPASSWTMDKRGLEIKRSK